MFRKITLLLKVETITSNVVIRIPATPALCNLCLMNSFGTNRHELAAFPAAYMIKVKLIQSNSRTNLLTADTM